MPKTAKPCKPKVDWTQPIVTHDNHAARYFDKLAGGRLLIATLLENGTEIATTYCLDEAERLFRNCKSGRSVGKTTPQEMTKALKLFQPSVPLLVKLGSIAVHTDELLSDDGHAFDREALRTLLGDEELQAWLAEMTKAALVPVKRK